MSGNRPGRVPEEISGAAQGGATILVLLGLAPIALGVYGWLVEAARPSSTSSDGTSWASGLGYGVAIVLIAAGSVVVGAGGWILVRPRPVPRGIGAAVAGGGALFMGWLSAGILGYQRGRPFDPSIAIPFILAALFLLAAILLAVTFVNTTPPPKEVPRGRRTSAKRRNEPWRDDLRARKPPPGHGTRRP
jgi:hypothetical protein